MKNCSPDQSSVADQTQPASPRRLAKWEHGRFLRIGGREEDALAVLRRGNSDDSNDYRLHHELGLTLLELNRHEEAIGSFLTALRLRPDFDEACYQIGIALASRGILNPAVAWFRRASEMNPVETKYLPPWGRILAQLGCLNEAAEVFQRWIAMDPGNPVARHLATAALGSPKATTAPPEYIRSVFDSSAAGFDEHLVKLKYCGPELLADALVRAAGNSKVRWDILDVGCGTGLVGCQVKSLSQRLVGVDLSAGMLEMARRRNLYDELIEADVIDYLGRVSHEFDVVTGSDVLTYIGDLSEFFRRCALALRKGGLVAVVLESIDCEGTFRLNPTGRFSHSPQYLRGMMECMGFHVTLLQKGTMRYESNQPVPSLVAVGSIDDSGHT